MTYTFCFISLPGICYSYEHSCSNGRCIDDSLACNGYNPCGDYSDCDVVLTGIIKTKLAKTSLRSIKQFIKNYRNPLTFARFSVACFMSLSVTFHLMYVQINS